jgi:hypothetical protein
MQQELENIKKNFYAELGSTESEEQLKELETKYLGKK